MAEGTAEDVKLEAKDSSPEAKDVKEEPKDSSPEVSDEDLDLVSSDNRNIPYARFKDVNDKRKEMERELKTLKSQMDHKVQDEVYRKEMELRRAYEDRLAAQQTGGNDFGYDDQETVGSNREIESLKAELSELKKTFTDVSTDYERQRIKGEVASLKDVYPELDEEHVYAMKRAKPEWTWEDCAEYSHNKFSKMVESRFKNMIEKKKADAKKKVLGSEGLRNIKPEDKPKSWAEARKKVAQYFDD